MAAATPTAAPPGNLTLSSATFAKLSPRPYLLANLQPPPDAAATTAIPPAGARANGRQPREARPPRINTSSLSHAHGSAVVRTGDTTVICGVRGETLPVSQIPNYRAAVAIDTGGATTDELRDYDLLVPNIELATGSAPNFLPGAPPTALAQTLSTRVYSLLHSARLLDAADLRIYPREQPQETTAATTTTQGGQEEGGNEEEDGGDTSLLEETTAQEVKAYWVLYIDLLFISFDGNPFDAAWAAVLAALRDTRLPCAYWDADREMVLCARERDTAPRPLRLRGLPVACTAAVFTATKEQRRRQQQQKRPEGDSGSNDVQQYWILVDPDRFEEGLCDEMVTVVVDRSAGEQTRILGLSKNGGTVVGPQVLGRLVSVAEERWQAFKGALES